MFINFQLTLYICLNYKKNKSREELILIGI